MKAIKSVLRPIWNSPFSYRCRGWWFDLSEKLSGYKKERQRFKENAGYEPNIKNPQSFSEHLAWKKIHDRNPILPVVADKYRVRQYLKEVLGEEADSILIPLLHVTNDPEKIPFDELKGEYIIKANHNSGPNFMVTNGKAPDRQKIISDLKEQLKRPYGTLKHEWAYGQIKKRLVVVEKLLRDSEGKIPKDYKFHMVNGECVFVQVDYDRFTDHSRTLYDKHWNYIPATLKFKQGPQTSKPENFNAMLDLATRLSKGFDYIRIDLYSVDGKVYFGEMTNYPGSGMEKFTPQSFDFELGKYWK